MYDYLIVGSGLFGATCARLLKEAGLGVLVIDKRPVIGGNCADVEVDGILVHQHGPHCFHTDNRQVWEWVQRFASWYTYEHRAKASVHGRVYSFPVNRMTAAQFYPDLAPDELRGKLARGLPPEMYETFYRGYSQKQWGKQPGADVLARIPVRDTWDDRYFGDRYQGLPEGGYSNWFTNVLAGIPTVLGADFAADVGYWMRYGRRVVYTGDIARLVGRQLPYRSLRFEQERHETDYQGCAVMNYPGLDVAWTRIVEHKYFTPHQRRTHTIITREIPQACDGANEPYYPLGDIEARQEYREILEGVRHRWPNLVAGGRLGSYRYLNMDETIKEAFDLVREETRR